MVRACRLYHLSVCVCVRVYCGKTADWIQMPFEMVGGVGLGMGVLDFGGDRRKGSGSFGGEFGRRIVTNGPLRRALLKLF